MWPWTCKDSVIDRATCRESSLERLSLGGIPGRPLLLGRRGPPKVVRTETKSLNMEKQSMLGKSVTDCAEGDFARREASCEGRDCAGDKGCGVSRGCREHPYCGVDVFKRVDTPSRVELGEEMRGGRGEVSTRQWRPASGKANDARPREKERMPGWRLCK